MINARSETAAQKPSFRDALRLRRCLVIADGFYEWRKVGREKIPTHFQLRHGAPFAFAGLWDCWTDPQTGRPLATYTVLTTEANELVRPIHHRMPVILTPDRFESWLDASANARSIHEQLRPLPATTMESWDVSRHVNAVANDDPQCRVAPLSLF